MARHKNPPVQFCKRGHDTFVTGRDKAGRCRPCRSIDWKETYIPHPKIFVQFCPQGHDKNIVGITTDNHCRACVGERTRTYYAEHQNEILEQKKEYSKDHKEEIALARKEFYQANRVRLDAEKKVYRDKHPEKHRLRNLRYKTERGLRVVKWGQRGISTFYHNKPNDMSIDHIIPLVNDQICGLHVRWNLQYLSLSDNLRKYNKCNLLEASNWYGKILERFGIK